MNAEMILPMDAGGEVNRGDYKKDGLWYCGTCHKAKQRHISIPEMGIQDRIVWVMCDCDEKREEQEKVRREYEEQQQRLDQLRTASMMPGKLREALFENYEIRDENSRAYRIAKKYADDFREMEKKNQGLLFYGPVGTGKSHTAACVANALMAKEIPVIMTSFVKILQDIQAMDRNEAAYLKTLNAARLLIVDDLGAERSTDYALEKVYNVIDSRVRANRPMILTTNLRTADMMKVQDIRYKRVYDRIFEVCYPVEINGTSFRMRQAAERQEAMRKMLE